MQPFVASCGSGVTANSLIFAAHLLGNDERAALRWQLERVGRRPGHPESDRSGLGEDDPGDVAQFTADLVDQGLLAARCGSRPFWRWPSIASMPAAVRSTSRAERRSNQR